ncbi:MAG: hypothetical protein DMF64_19195 [Acidobacteria bacterium]|nr:MAG: hypothetical protein DMF64_19195 [Acidobacteriota bacterium]
MRNNHQRLLSCVVLAAWFIAPALVLAQEGVVVLTGAQLARVVPPGFYYSGQSAPTQLRNAAAARFGKARHVIAGLVDTSGYSADVRASYEGFLIADAPITIQGSDLSTGAYGFGFTDDGKLNVFDVGGRNVLTVTTDRDARLRRPRPLMMQQSTNGVRLYSGRSFVSIAVK